MLLRRGISKLLLGCKLLSVLLLVKRWMITELLLLQLLLLLSLCTLLRLRCRSGKPFRRLAQ